MLILRDPGSSVSKLVLGGTGANTRGYVIRILISQTTLIIPLYLENPNSWISLGIDVSINSPKSPIPHHFSSTLKLVRDHYMKN